MAVGFDVDRAALDGQVGGVLFWVLWIEGFDETKTRIISLRLFRHVQQRKSYRAMAFETNSEEYPYDGTSVLGGSKLRYENDMILVRGLFEEVVLCLKLKSKSQGGFL